MPNNCVYLGVLSTECHSFDDSSLCQVITQFPLGQCSLKHSSFLYTIIYIFIIYLFIFYSYLNYLLTLGLGSIPPWGMCSQSPFVHQEYILVPLSQWFQEFSSVFGCGCLLVFPLATKCVFYDSIWGSYQSNYQGRAFKITFPLLHRLWVRIIHIHLWTFL